MNIRRVKNDEIDLLVKLRLDFFELEGRKTEPAVAEFASGRLRDYFSRRMPMNEFVALVAEEEGKVTGAIFLTVIERPIGAELATYRLGQIYSVMTYPEFRCRGIASALLKAMIAEAKKMDLAAIDLNATEDGRPLYEKAGFTPIPYTGMRLSLA